MSRSAIRCTAAIALLVAAACGSARPPPEHATDELTGAVSDPAPSPSGPQSLVESSGPPPCSVGTNGDVCACVDVTLTANAPKLYFILDRSSSMALDGKWTTMLTVLGSLITKLGTRAVVGAAAFPSPTSNPNGCVPGQEVLSPRAGGASTAAALKAALKLAPSGGTPMAATLHDLANRIHSLSGKTYVILATDGGPNCNQTATCLASACQMNIESGCTSNRRYCCTPSGSNCCDPAIGGDPLLCLDTEPTVAAVTNLASSGVPVYVVGIPGSEPYALVLDALARAGGTARGSEPQYYDVTTADPSALEAALSKIAAAVTASCTLTLDNAPPDATLVNVFFDGQPIAQPGDNGWTLDGSTVTLLGAACAQVQSGSVLDVRVVAGCPTILN